MLDDVVDGQANARLEEEADSDLSPFSQNRRRCVSVAHMAV